MFSRRVFWLHSVFDHPRLMVVSNDLLNMLRIMPFVNADELHDSSAVIRLIMQMLAKIKVPICKPLQKNVTHFHVASTLFWNNIKTTSWSTCWDLVQLVLGTWHSSIGNAFLSEILPLALLSLRGTFKEEMWTTPNWLVRLYGSPLGELMAPRRSIYLNYGNHGKSATILCLFVSSDKTRPYNVRCGRC